MPLFKRKQAKSLGFTILDKQKTNSTTAGKDSTVKRSPSTRSIPQSPDSVNGDIGVPSSVLGPTGQGISHKLVLSEEALTLEGDTGQTGLTPRSPMRTSSRLSKTMEEALHDKDALHCFIHFMEAQQADRFIRFWVDANSFQASTLTRMRTHSLQSVGSSALLKRRSEGKDVEGGAGVQSCGGGGGEKSCQDSEGGESCVTGHVQEGEVDDRDLCCDRAKVVMSGSVRVDSDGCGGDTTSQLPFPNSAAGLENTQLSDRESAGREGKPSSLSLPPVCVQVTQASEDSPSTSTSQQEENVSSNTDHSQCSLQDSGIATPSDGDFVISPGSQSDCLGDGESVDTLLEEDSRRAASHPAKTENASTASQEDRNGAPGSAAVHGGDLSQAGTVIGKVDNKEEGARTEDTAVKSHRSVSVEEMKEKLKKSIERDAVSIFTKYIAKDAPQPIGVDDTLRGETISKICQEDKQVDPECFVACQEFVVSIMKKQYHKPFMDSEFHCKHQVTVLTGSQVYLADILYNEHALCYFMEFMEQEAAQHLMQFWMAADNFRQQLVQQEGGYDGLQAQNDAMILYDRFFSLQATTPLGFDDKIRFEVEGNICRENGPLPDCFAKPMDIVLHTFEKVYFTRYMSSEIYYRYLSDLISTVQMAQDLPVKRHRRQASDASSEHSAGSQSVGTEGISTRNTLLAASTRGSRKALSSSSSASLNIAGKIEEHLGTMDTDFLNPDQLWKQPSKSSLRLGSVNSLGQFVSEFDPDPDSGKKKGGGFFKKNRTKEKEQEQMAMQVAQMILSDVANMTQMGDACARTDDGSTTHTTTTTTSTASRPQTLSSTQSLSSAFSSSSFFEPPPS